jgi:hypothetical protein
MNSFFVELTDIRLSVAGRVPWTAKYVLHGLLLAEGEAMAIMARTHGGAGVLNGALCEYSGVASANG